MINTIIILCIFSIWVIIYTFFKWMWADIYKYIISLLIVGFLLVGFIAWIIECF